jgi:hypothetical protein
MYIYIYIYVCSPVSWESLYIHDIACCPHSGLVAVSVACKPSNSKRSGDINTDDVDDPVDGDLILPVVAVYSAALSPSLSLVLLRCVSV